MLHDFLGMRVFELLTLEQEREIWDALLDADMNARYWGIMGRRHQKYEKSASIFLAAVASSTVATWSVWQAIEWVWQTLSVTAAILAVALPIVNLGRNTESMFVLAEHWSRIQGHYEELWRDRGIIDTEKIMTRLQEIKQLENDFIPKVSRLPHRKKIINKIYKEVCVSRGIS